MLSMWLTAAGQPPGIRLQAQPAELQLLCDVWTSENGLPQNTVQAVSQTSDGYIWLGTQEGLVRYDGVQFTVFDMKNTPQFRQNIVNCLLEDREGRLWIGTGQGLLCYQNGKFTAWTSLDGLSSDSINSLHQDRQGALWIGTVGGGLVQYRGGKFTSWTTRQGLADNFIWSIAEDKDGSLWMGTNNGLAGFRGEKFSIWTTRDGLAHNYVWAVLAGRDGSIWCGTSGGLTQVKDGAFKTYTVRDGLSSNIVRALHEDADGTLWIGTERGLNRLRQGEFSGFTSKNGLSGDIVRVITRDHEGSLWVGTSSGGLNRLRQSRFFTFGTREGIPYDHVRTVYEGRDGSIWTGTSGGGLARLKQGRVTIWNTRNGLPSNSIRGLLEDSSGAFWAGTDAGLVRIRGGRVDVWTVKDGLTHDHVRTVHEDREGTIWIGTSSGINLFSKGRLAVLRQDGSPQDLVRVIREDSQGNVWVGSNAGVTMWQGGQPTTWTRQDGLSENSVFDIHEDRQGTLWIGTYGGGLNRFRDGRFTPITIREGLFDNIVFRILEDDQGYLWMSCNKGVYRVSLQQLNDLADGRIRSVSCTAYGQRDGMKNSECNGGSFPAGWRSRDGRMWFPTIKGVAVVNPGNLKFNRVVPPVAIERIMTGNRQIGLGDEIVLPPGSGQLEIHYTAFSFRLPERIQFRYRLEGFDRDWVEAGNRRTAYYTNLPPGSYRFRVLASNDDGVWNQTGASLSLSLRSYFYQTGWFYLFCGLGLCLAGYGIFHWRIHSLRMRELDLSERVRERTLELESEIEVRQRISRQLDERRSFLRHIIDIDPNLIIIKDREGRFTLVNTTAANAYGTTVEEMIGKTDYDFCLVRDEADKFRRDDLEVMESLRDKFILEEKNTDSQGCVRWMQTIKRPIIDSSGRASQVLVVVTDITERKKAELRLRETLSQLEFSNRELQEFAFVASHDLQEPLRKVQTFGDRLKMKYAGHLDETGRDYIERMQSATARMQTLINDLLGYSRVTTKARPFVGVELMKTARDVVADLEARIEDTGGRVEIESLPTLDADPTQMRQLLQNLVGNGLKFHRPGVPPVVTMRSRAIRDEATAVSQWQIEVSDNGIGFEEKYLDKIFTIFQRLHGREQYEGTGVGLAVCRKIVERHGGTITARSQPGAGATFIITLPAQQDTASQKTLAASARNSQQNAGD